MLEAVPRPAAEEPDAAVVLGVRREQEPRVRRELVLARAGADERCVGQRGEPGGDVGAHARLMLGARDPAQGLGVDLGALDVGRDLHAAPVEVAQAVGGAVVVDPAGDAGRRPRGARPEEEHVLLRDAQAHEVTEEPRQPRTAGPRHAVGLQAGAVVEDHRRAVRPGGGRHQPCAPGDGVGRQRPGRVARPQDARLGLEQGEGEVVAGEAREQPGRVDALAGHAERPQRPLGGGLPAVGAPCQPDDAGRRDEPRVELAPERERPPRERGVEGVVAVRGADEARLAARPGPRVPGCHGLDERDVPARHGAAPRQRGAEDPRPDDDDRPAHGDGR